MKFLRFLPVFFLVSCITFINYVYAQTKIGVIDTNKIVEKCTAYVQAKKVIEDEFSKSEKEAGEMQEKFSKRVEDLENKKNIMSAKEYNKKREELNKEAQILQKKFYDKRINLDKEFNNINKTLNDSLIDIVKNLSEKNHITVTIHKGMVFYSDDSTEITDEVISEVNKRLKSIDVNLPQSKDSDSK